LTDQLISYLARIASLTVISRTSSMRYRGTDRSLPEIARDLRVDGIVEGSVHTSGNHLRVDVRLMHGLEDRQLWAGSFADTSASGQDIETRIALAIAHQISARLTAEDRSRLIRPGWRHNPVAYEACLRGRQLFNRRTGTAIPEAETWFRQALTTDPNFALAWAGLSDCHTIGWSSAHRDFRLGEEYARKAIASEPDLAEGHTSLAMALMCQYRYAESGAELTRALELNPNSVTARQFRTIWLMTMGRLTEALAESDRALQLDPFSLPVNTMRGFVLTASRRYDPALEQAHIARSIAPDSVSPYEQLARQYWLRQRPAEALEAESRLAEVTGQESWKAEIAHARTLLNRSRGREACLAVAAARARLYKRIPTGGFEIAFAYAYARDREQVLRWLDRLIGEGGYATAMLLKTAPEFEFVRGEPRFRALLRRIGVPES
jgi:tetratricopeptide (TPR) repeat protein